MKQKSENQKALPKFFKLLAVAGLIGGVLGSLSCVAGYFWQEHDLGASFARMLNARLPVGNVGLLRRASGDRPPSLPFRPERLPQLGRRG